jgi:hypothetical protein
MAFLAAEAGAVNDPACQSEKVLDFKKTNLALTRLL